MDSYKSSQSIAPDLKIYIAGLGRLVGTAIWRNLESRGYTSLKEWSSSELDLRDSSSTKNAILVEKPEVIIMTTAQVRGITANSTLPVGFLYENIHIQTNIFEAENAAKVPQLLFLGSSCIYAKFADQPTQESSLLIGQLQKSNDAYTIAKIAGVLQVLSYRKQHGRRWISAMPTNLYRPGNNFDLSTSHVLPPLILSFHEAKELGSSSVTLWGTGAPLRKFLHTDDLAKACLHLLENYEDPEPVNIDWCRDISIKDLATLIAETVGFSGDIEWNTSKPDGTPRKLLDISNINALGWQLSISLRDGIDATYRWYLENNLNQFAKIGKIPKFHR